MPSLPTLKALRLVCCNLVTAESLQKVFKASQLLSLGIESCNSIDAEMFPLPPTLGRLSLSNLSSLDSRQLVRAISAISLHSLDLSNMMDISESNLDAICKSQGKLEELGLGGCGQLDSGEVERIVKKRCTSLKFLDLSFCKKGGVYRGLKGFVVVDEC